MSNFSAKVKAFLVGESGTTSVEYAVMLALIIAVCIAAITVFGNESNNMWGNNSSQIQSAFN